MTLEHRLNYRPDSPYVLTAREKAAFEEILGTDFHEDWRFTVYIDESHAYDYKLDRKTDQVTFHLGRHGLYETLSQRRFSGRIKGLRYYRNAYEELRKEQSDNPADYLPPLRALCYPSATPSRSLISAAALYFDEVYVIHPGRDLGRSIGDDYIQTTLSPERVFGQQEFYRRLTEFDQEVISLKEHGILHTLPPMMQDHPHFVEMLLADIGDQRFETLVRNTSTEKMFVAGLKMHPVRHLIGEGENVNQIRAQLKARMPHFEDSFGETLFRGHYGVNEVDSVVGSSILLNHALLLSEDLRFLPVTDDPLFRNLLAQKMNRITEMKGYQDFRNELKLKSASLAIRAIEEYLPAFHFESYEQLLETREHMKNRLSDFRQAIAAFAADIDQSPYSATFPEKIERLVATKIKPAVAALQSEIRNARDSFTTRVLTNIQRGTIPIVGLLFAGLPSSLVIAISAGLITFEAAIQTYKETKKLRCNGLALLIN